MFNKFLRFLFYAFLLFLVIYGVLFLFNFSQALQLYVYCLDMFKPLYLIHYHNMFFDFLTFPINYFYTMATDDVMETRLAYWYILVYLYIPVIIIVVLIILYVLFKS